MVDLTKKSIENIFLMYQNYLVYIVYRGVWFIPIWSKDGMHDMAIQFSDIKLTYCLLLQILYLLQTFAYTYITQ